MAEVAGVTIFARGHGSAPDPPSWDERHELSENALLAHLERVFAASRSYDDSIQSWFATVEEGAGWSIDVTEMAADINVALGPTPDLVPFVKGAS